MGYVIGHLSLRDLPMHGKVGQFSAWLFSIPNFTSSEEFGCFSDNVVRFGIAVMQNAIKAYND